jgi:hypothetical protein
MGADIHTFIEYSDFVNHEGERSWSCMGGRYNPGRDYTMFGLLAGVRGRNQLIDTRGLPERTSWEVDGYMWRRINDDLAAKEVEGYVTLADAQRWNEPIENDRDGKPYRVMDPDLHSHSWLTVEELEYVLGYYRLGEQAERIAVDPEDRQVVIDAVAALRGGHHYEPGWDGILGAMKALKARDCEVRFVFCFDN